MSITWRTRSSWNRRRCLRRRAIRRHPNDHWIRNVNPRLRTLPVTADAPVTVSTLSWLETGDSQTSSTTSLSKLASYGDVRGPTWAWVRSGR